MLVTAAVYRELERARLAQRILGRGGPPKKSLPNS